jgi:hypothetical protein
MAAQSNRGLEGDRRERQAAEAGSVTGAGAGESLSAGRLERLEL